MIMTESGAPMEATFKILTLFGSAKKRVYEIRLNNAYNTPFDEILLRELPFDAQVGILAHELGHVVYYDRLNALEIGNWGLQYLFNEDFQSIHEKTTDLMPVYYGMGWQVYNYAKYVRESEKTKPLYEAFGSFIDKYYLTQFEIYEFMNEEGIY